MRLHIILFLATAVLQCQAASLPDIKTPIQTITDVKNIQDGVKLVKDEKEEPIKNNASEEELIQPVNPVQEIGNELKTQKVDKIPVKIVPEVKPSLKSETAQKDAENEIKDENNEKPLEDPKKPDVQKVEKPEDDKKEDCKPTIIDISDFDSDVEEPGSQNEEPNLALAFITEALSTAHQNIQLTVDTFAKAFQTWVRDQSNLLPSEEQIKIIIDINIKKLNETLSGYFSPAQAAKLVEVDGNVITNQSEKIESELKKLENDFEKDAKIALGTERAENGTNSSGNVPGGGIGGGPAIFQNFQEIVQQGFTNISNSFTSLFNQGGSDNSTNNIFALFGQNFGNFFNPPSGSTQSDEGVTSRPTIFQSIQNIFRPPFQQTQSNQPQATQPQADQPQPQSQPQPNRPIINAIQGNPIVQTISGVFNRNPNKPSTLSTSETKPAEEGSNIVPEKPEPSADPIEEAPQAENDKEKPESVSEVHASGPIQQAIQKNPIVQGFAGAVQKIQNTISNPEKPRKVGHLIHHFHGIHHHGGHGGESGDKFVVDVDHLDPSATAGHHTTGSVGSAATTQFDEKKADSEKKENPTKTDEIKLVEEPKVVEQKTE